MIDDLYSIKGRVIIVTGGGGFIGMKHAEAILNGGGIPVLLDIVNDGMEKVKKKMMEIFPQAQIESFVTDITKRDQLEKVRDILLSKYGHIDGLINNAANNPKMEGGSKNLKAIQFSNFPLDIWNDDIAVGLTGALLCCQVFGEEMVRQNKGVIINISSDYGLIAPNQSIYRKDGIPEDQQIVKPVSYSVVKHGIIGLTKYLAVYWAKKGVRVNTLCPASLENGQDPVFIEKISELIPLGRMSKPDEYLGAILFMLSDSSSYMTGSTLVLDGGRTIW